MIRDDIKAATIAAMKAGDKDRTAALRQISAKIKDRDIEERTSGKAIPDDELVVSVLQKMAKQRRESIEMYVSGGREELAAVERAELAVIQEFLPQMMDEAETIAAIAAIKAETGAATMKDMGTVMAELKARHGAMLDGKLASTLVKAALS
ncbi:MAG: GatB/YqeY domain-containing protein [Erythrobacter sp.]